MDFGLDYGHWTTDFGLQTSDTSDYGLWTMDYGLRTLDNGLRTIEHQAVGTHWFVVLRVPIWSLYCYLELLRLECLRTRGKWFHFHSCYSNVCRFTKLSLASYRHSIEFKTSSVANDDKYF